MLGASPNPSRYSYLAVERLLAKGHEVIALGLRKGFIYDTEILTGTPPLENIHTITLYIRPELQKPLYEYIFSLHPKRIIFNPGTENDELRSLAESKQIETDYSCTLVLLSMNTY